MSTMTSADPVVRADPPPWWTRRRLILLVSLFVVPVALNVAFNSYGALTVDSALRMAFAAVAGQTIAVVGALAALVVTITHRRHLAGIVLFGLVFVLVTVYACAAAESAGALLLDRLELVAEAGRRD
ncbi:hypothetical protein ABS642_05930 [Microbacterium sp. A8/3-1]|uniref:Uncharacterized protein n=1 Tax=Microbacterium sp. A8/3-1 TaxID=3160749 RepID=A0AAU7VZU2_9MICO